MQRVQYKANLLAILLIFPYWSYRLSDHFENEDFFPVYVAILNCFLIWDKINRISGFRQLIVSSKWTEAVQKGMSLFVVFILKT